MGETSPAISMVAPIGDTSTETTGSTSSPASQRHAATSWQPYEGHRPWRRMRRSSGKLASNFTAANIAAGSSQQSLAMLAGDIVDHPIGILNFAADLLAASPTVIRYEEWLSYPVQSG